MIEEAPVSSIDLVLDFDSESMQAETADDAGPDTLRAPELSEEIARWAEEIGLGEDDDDIQERLTRPAIPCAKPAAAHGV